MAQASRQVVVKNTNGLHARPAMEFVDQANKFAADILVRKGGEEPYDADGKSIMAMVSLGATKGTPLVIEAVGADADVAVEALAGMFTERFGE